MFSLIVSRILALDSSLLLACLASLRDVLVSVLLNACLLCSSCVCGPTSSLSYLFCFRMYVRSHCLACILGRAHLVFACCGLVCLWIVPGWLGSISPCATAIELVA